MKPYKKRDWTPEEARAVWLLNFMQQDLTTLRPGEQIDLLEDCATLLGWRDKDAVRVLPPDGYALALGKKKWPDSVVLDVQQELNRGVKELEAGGSWRPFDEALTPVFCAKKDKADRTIERRYDGKYGAVMLASAVDLLVKFWPQIRRCELASCHRLFLPADGRQRFHVPACADLARGRDYVQEEQAAARREQKKKKKASPKGKGRTA